MSIDPDVYQPAHLPTHHLEHSSIPSTACQQRARHITMAMEVMHSSCLSGNSCQTARCFLHAVVPHGVITHACWLRMALTWPSIKLPDPIPHPCVSFSEQTAVFPLHACKTSVACRGCGRSTWGRGGGAVGMSVSAPRISSIVITFHGYSCGGHSTTAAKDHRSFLEEHGCIHQFTTCVPVHATYVTCAWPMMLPWPL